MASVRQVESWVLASLEANLAPDVLWVAKSEQQGAILVCLRKPGSKSDEGDWWTVTVELANKEEER